MKLGMMVGNSWLLNQMKSFCFKKMKFEKFWHFLSVLATKMTNSDFNDLVNLISKKKLQKALHLSLKLVYHNTPVK